MECFERRRGVVPMPKVCTCGRSETGQCVGLHSLSAQEFFERNQKKAAEWKAAMDKKLEEE